MTTVKDPILTAWDRTRAHFSKSKTVPVNLRTSWKGLRPVRFLPSKSGTIRIGHHCFWLACENGSSFYHWSKRSATSNGKTRFDCVRLPASQLCHPERKMPVRCEPRNPDV